MSGLGATSGSGAVLVIAVDLGRLPTRIDGNRRLAVRFVGVCRVFGAIPVRTPRYVRRIDGNRRSAVRFGGVRRLCRPRSMPLPTEPSPAPPWARGFDTDRAERGPDGPPKPYGWCCRGRRLPWCVETTCALDVGWRPIGRSGSPKARPERPRAGKHSGVLSEPPGEEPAAVLGERARDPGPRGTRKDPAGRRRRRQPRRIPSSSSWRWPLVARPLPAPGSSLPSRALKRPPASARITGMGARS